MAQKNILVAAVGPGRTHYSVIANPPMPPLRQAIIPGLREGLRGLGHAPGSDFEIHYVEADRDADPSDPWSTLRKAIGQALTASKPDLVFPIAYHATRAAKDAVAASSSPSTPIIFVVVSDPAPYGIVPGPNITGYSTMLRHITPFCLELFAQTYPKLKTVHAMYQPDMPSATDAKHDLDQTAKRLGLNPIVYKTVNHRKEIVPYVSGLPPRVGLLVIGDDLVVSETATFLPVARNKNIPVFVQVVEFTTTPAPPGAQNFSALGGYGIPGEGIGKAAADYVDRVLWRGADPGQLHVEYLTGFQWWVNKDVANGYGFPFPGSYHGVTPIGAPPEPPAPPGGPGGPKAAAAKAKQKLAPPKTRRAKGKAPVRRRAESGRKKKS